MKKVTVRNMVLAGLFIAMGLVLPFFTAQVPSIGKKLLPMHIPVLISGFVCGWPYGLLIGFIVPILRSVFFGMPIMFPTAIAMSFELAVYGCMTGLMYELLPKKNISIYLSLIISMLSGRVAWGIASMFLFGLNGTPFTWEVFMAGAFINAIPGIVIQLIIIPAIIVGLERSKVMAYAR
jgi:thiamine transporter ThiT